MSALPESIKLAFVEVRIRHRGQDHRTMLRCSDSLSGAFVHSLLTEAINQVRDSYNQWETREKVSGLEAAADQADAAAETAWRAEQDDQAGGVASEPFPVAEATPLPHNHLPDAECSCHCPRYTQVSSLPSKADQCTALVERRLSHNEGIRREQCGHQTAPDGTCPQAKHHLGAGISVKQELADEYAELFGAPPPENLSMVEMRRAIRHAKAPGPNDDLF